VARRGPAAGGRGAGDRLRGAHPLGHEQLEPRGPGAAGGPRATDARQTTDASPEFRRVEQRLRELGATYYLLETCGTEGDGYRFFCKMGLGGSDRLYRCFQAVDSDPLRAMQTALAEVEQWRGQRRF
jgi:hypothetical protein